MSASRPAPEPAIEERFAAAMEQMATAMESLSATVESVVIGQAELVAQLIDKLDDAQTMTALPPGQARRLAMEKARARIDADRMPPGVQPNDR